MSFQQYFSEEHEMLRQTARHFVAQEILPYIDEWEEAGTLAFHLICLARLLCGKN